MHRFIPLSAISVSGPLEERIQRAASRLLELRPMVVECNLGRYGPDFSGRWIEVMSQLQQYTGHDYQLDEIIQNLLVYQQSDGHISHPDQPFLFRHDDLPCEEYAPWLNKELKRSVPDADGADADQGDLGRWWGQGRGIVGLMAYFQMTGNKVALDAACKLGDFCVNRFPLGKTNVIDSYEDYYLGILEGPVMLWEATQDSRYLSLAKAIAERVAHNSLNRSDLKAGVQTHSFLTARRGLLDLYGATGETRYLDGAIRAQREIEQVIWITGGINEVYNVEGDRSRPNDETCSTADWLRLNLRLWQLTGETGYLEHAEVALYNQMALDQLPNGGFTNGTTLAHGGTQGHEMHYCCSEHGPRALCDVLASIYSVQANDQALCVNWFFDSQATVALPGLGTVRIQQKTSYPLAGRTTLMIDLDEPKVFPIKVRVPSHSEFGLLALNGQAISPPKDQCYWAIENQWHPGDKLEFRVSPITQPVTRNYRNTLGAKRLVSEFADEMGGGTDEAGVPVGIRTGIMQGPLVVKVDRDGDDLFKVNVDLLSPPNN